MLFVAISLLLLVTLVSPGIGKAMSVMPTALPLAQKTEKNINLICSWFV